MGSRDSGVPDSNAELNPYKEKPRSVGQFFKENLIKTIFTILALITFGWLVYNLFWEQKLFRPQCPLYGNRECNDRGTCNQGVCECDILYSGNACTETAIPGYTLESNTECSGNGLANPFLIVVPECQNSWVSTACQEYLSQQRTLIVENDNNLLLVNGAVTLPTCVCTNTFGGLDCSTPLCPRDENGQTCGANSIKTVGPYFNYSVPQYNYGCQCLQAFSLLQPEYFSRFSDAAKLLLASKYNDFLRQLNCGEAFATDFEDVFLFYTPPDASRCFCEENFYGNVCQFGSCPVSPQTKTICSGNGADNYGFKALNNRRVPVCETGYEYSVLLNECSPIADESVPLFITGNLLNTNKTCSPGAPIRCALGECATLPSETTDTCRDGFTSGTWDISQFDVLIADRICSNFTVERDITECFRNETVLDQILNIRNNSIVFDVEQNITIDLGSPLLYFSAEFLGPDNALVVRTFNGASVTSDTQSVDNDVPELTVGSFQYIMSDYDRYVEEESEVFLLTNDVTTTSFDFWIYPITTWNYSGELAYNETYEVIRLNREYTFTISDSRIQTFPFDYVVIPDNGVFIGRTFDNIYLNPSTLTQIEYFTCFNDPTGCAWYMDASSGQIRTLDNSSYICTDIIGNNTVPIIQSIPCDETFWSYGPDIRILTWRTEILGNLESSYSIPEDESFVLERSLGDSTSFPFSISMASQNASDPVTLSNLVFITIDDINIPCVCDISSASSNMSDLNRLWSEQDFRVITTPAVNDFVVAKRFTEGLTEIIRAQVISFNEEAQTMVVNPVRDYDGDSFGVFYKNARNIDFFDINDGLDDTVQKIAPIRCPSGTKSNLDSGIAFIETDCNCTQSFPQNETSCVCHDGDNSFNCEFTVDNLNCGVPATQAFEAELSQYLNGLGVDPTCNCVIYENNEVTDILEGERINDFEFEFDYVNENYIPYKLTVFTENCTDNTRFNLSDTNAELTDIDYNITFQIERKYDCFYDLLIDYEDTFNFPINSLTLEINDGGIITSAQAHFNNFGFSLNNVEQPSVTTSSGFFNGSYWISEEQQIHFIDFTYSRRYIPSFSVVSFANTGRIYNGFDIQSPVELQASNDGSDWYLLGMYFSFGDDVQAINLTSINATSFSRYRLLSRSPFGIFNWNMFTNQKCDCGDMYLTVNLTSTDGLRTYQDWIDSIDFQFANQNQSVLCVAEDNCFIELGGERRYVSNDGVCNDEIFVQSQFDLSVNRTIINSTLFDIETFGFPNKNYTVYNSSLTIVQYTNGSYYSIDELVLAFGDYLAFGFLLDTEDTIYYYIDSDNVIYEANTTQSTTNDTFDRIFDNSTNTILERTILENLPELTAASCSSGLDYTDCGTSNRLLPIMVGYNCELNDTAVGIRNDILNRTGIFTNKTYLLTNFTNLIDPYNINYYNVKIYRKKAVPLLSDCEGQTFSNPNRTYYCKNGTYAENSVSCLTEYTEVGNGCVNQLDVDEVFEAFRCACREGFAGDACQFGTTTSALPENLETIPASEETACGGPPPLTIRPPVVNSELQIITPEILVEINRRVTGNSAPRSDLDIDYHRVLPIFAPYGQRIKVQRTMSNGEIIYSTCPFARKGENGTYFLLVDDVSSRDTVTGAPVWKTYTLSNGATTTYPWTSIVAYDDFPYRCPNGQCVEDRSLCERSQELFPICNNQGECRADGSCDCYPGWRTFVMNDVYSASLKPYQDPTEWRYNDNWRHHSTSQCTARDCEGPNNPCTVPSGCFPGTPEINFIDKLIRCPNIDFCAPSLDDCISQVNLESPVTCSGKGILAQKDFSEQLYCICGDPISDQIDIGNITEITQLKPNGFGGPECENYYATRTAVVWSAYDYENDQPYRSAVTGEILPGKYVGYNDNFIGADPAEFEEWAVCCDRSIYPRLELCPFVPCRVNGVIGCEEAAECRDPLVYPCNNNGVARADGTCLCDTSTEEGVGYTSDFNEYGDPNCYLFVQCPIDDNTGRTCNYFEPCTEPEQWIYPFPYDIYLEQQNFTMGIDSRGEYSNITLLNALSTGSDIYERNLYRAATDIALSVISAENNLAGCVCTDEMLPFNRPYLIPDEVTAVNVTWIPQFNLTYNLNLVRVFYQGAGVLSINNEFGDPVCSSDINLVLLNERDWNPSQIRCGSTYQCVNLISEPGYFTNCGFDDNSEDCVTFKQNACAAVANSVYWPDDSPNDYFGCNRNDDPNGCNCCKVISPVSAIDFTSIDIEFYPATANSSVEIIRFYGVGNEILPLTDDEEAWKAVVSGTDSACIDERFYLQYFDADNSYYVPTDPINYSNQLKCTYEDAALRCEETGGYLAVTDNLLFTNNIDAITRTCSQISEEQDTCWIAARDRDIDEYTRDTFFEDTCRVCYQDFDITSYPATTFDTAQVPGQVVSNPVVQDIDDYNYYRNQLLNFVFVPPEKFFKPFTVFDEAQRLIDEGLIKYNYLTTRPQTFIPFSICTVTLSKTRRAPNGNILERWERDITFETLAEKLNWGKAIDLYALKWTRYYRRVCEGIFVITCNIRQFPVSDARLVKEFDEISQSFGCDDTRTNIYPRSYCLDADRLSSANDNDKGVYGGGTLVNLPVGVLSDEVVRVKAEQGYTCIRLYYNQVGYSKVAISVSSRTATSSGREDIDLILGYRFVPYLPVFIRMVREEYVHPIIGRGFLRGDVLLSDEIPVYLLGNPIDFRGSITDTYQVTPFLQCSDCDKTITAEYAWDDKIYRTSGFLDELSGPNPQLFLYLDNQYRALAGLNTPQYKGYFMQQTTYIDPDLPQLVDWELDECLISDENGLSSSVCTEKVTRNFICQYDYTKNMAQSGTDCSTCGTGSRVSGAPQPGVDCFENFPLADPAQFPLQHQLKDAWQGGYLNVYIDSYYLDNPEISYPNTSVITAYDLGWEFWRNDRSTRQKSLSSDEQPSSNWKDGSLTNNWPIDCGNGYCATSQDFCDTPLADVNRPMAFEDVPISLAAVPESQSFIDTTCGVNIFLRDYVTITKDGPSQDQNQIKILRQDFDGVELQSLDGGDMIFLNNLKNPSKFIFNINVTNTINFNYRVNCLNCISSVQLRLFIHTLSDGLTPVEKIFGSTFTLDTSGVTDTIQDSFTVPQTNDDTTIGDQVLPQFVYQGVGFEVSGLTRGSAIELFNPIVTNVESRSACKNRTLPQWFEPKARIKSSIPVNQCIFSGDSKGQCSCAFNMGGPSCSYFTVNGEVCGGYGTEGAITSEIVSNSDGAYFDDGVFGCNTYNLGNVIFSTLVPNTISQYPEVFVENVPLSADRELYVEIPNGDNDYYGRDDIELECELEIANLPFAINPDEFEKAVRQLELPIYFNMNQQFENIDDNNLFLTDNPIPVDIGNFIDCVTYSDLCVAANYNNYVFRSTFAGAGTEPELTDGDLSTSYTGAGTLTVTIDPSADLLILVYLFGGGPASVSCNSAGTCVNTASGATYEVFECRCPTYQLDIAAGTYEELQVFNFLDSTRASIYEY